MRILFIIISVLSIFRTTYGDDLAIVAMFKNEAPYIDEWITYHRLVGVEHFYLYNNSSQDNTLEILIPYIEEGIVDVYDWPSKSGDSNHVAAQIKAYKDGLRRTNGNTKWVALIDLDEYLLPYKYKTVTECLDAHFSMADAVYVNWRHFGTSGLTIPLYETILTKLVKSSYWHHPRNVVGKSIVRPDKVQIDKQWYVHHCVLKPGARYYNGSMKYIETTEDLQTDGRHHGKIIVLHHYGHRDEWNFVNIRVPRYLKRFGSIEELMQHHGEFNKYLNNDMIKYLKAKHPEAYQKYWKRTPTSKPLELPFQQ